MSWAVAFYGNKVQGFGDHVVSGFESEREAQVFATMNERGKGPALVRQAFRDGEGSFVGKVRIFKVNELEDLISELENKEPGYGKRFRDAVAKRIADDEAAEAERQAQAEARAAENARKVHERKVSELAEQMEREAFLAERAKWRKAAEKELAKRANA